MQFPRMVEGGWRKAMKRVGDAVGVYWVDEEEGGGYT